MEPQDALGRPASELSDEELEQQGTHAHDTRNWVFLHGTADQFARHTSRMHELEQEYLRRHPKRTWQGSADADVAPTVDEATVLRGALRAMVRQAETVLAQAAQARSAAPSASPAGRDPATALLERVLAAGGRMHKLEAHQAAREVGLDRTTLARLYSVVPPLLATEQQERVITDAGRRYLSDRS